MQDNTIMNNNMPLSFFFILISVSLPNFCGDFVSGKTILELKKFCRHVKKESKKNSTQDAWIEQKTYDLNESFTQKHLTRHQSKKWAIASFAEHKIGLSLFGIIINPHKKQDIKNIIGSFIIEEIEKSKLFDEKTKQIASRIWKVETTFSNDNAAMPVTIFIDKQNRNAVGLSAGFFFSEQYKFIYALTPQKQSACFILKKRSADDQAIHETEHQE